MGKAKSEDIFIDPDYFLNKINEFPYSHYFIILTTKLKGEKISSEFLITSYVNDKKLDIKKNLKISS